LLVHLVTIIIFHHHFIQLPIR